MSVVIKNIGEFHGQMAAWMESVKVAAAEAAMGLAHEAFEHIVEHGPQGSGDFVANTKVAVGAPNTDFTPSAVGVVRSGVFQRGDSEAMNYARDRANWQPGKLGQSVFISSSAEHDEPYAVKIEQGVINLRPVNAGADHIYRNAAAHTARVNARIDKARLIKLRSVAK